MTLKTKLGELFGIDTRTLALFRVILALLILGDLAVRMSDLTAHYTDAGLISRALADKSPTPWGFSFHSLFDGWAWPLALMILAGVFALALLVGYHTRLATLGSWVLAVSIQSRNLYVHQGGDDLLRLLLFWSIFLPLGNAFSVDRALREDADAAPKTHASMATFAILLQVCFMYWFSVVLKTDPAWTTDRTAVYFAMNVDLYATRLAVFLRDFPEFLEFLTASTLLIEMWAPAAFFCPFATGPVRTVAAFSLILMHVGFALCLSIGYFPYVGIAACTLALPAWFWDRVLLRRAPTVPGSIRIYFDGTCGFCRKMVRLSRTFLGLPSLPVLAAQEVPEIQEILRRETTWIVVDGDGRRHLRFEGFLALCRISPIFWPLEVFLRLRPVAIIGDALYRSTACRRPLMGSLTKFLRIRPAPAPRMSRLRPVLAVGLDVFLALMIGYVFLLNLQTVRYPTYMNLLPRALHSPGRWLALGQRWSLFAPHPQRDDGWFVISGLRADGSRIDLLRDGAPMSAVKPPQVSALYPNVRWRKFMRNVWTYRSGELPALMAAYFEREWNARHDAPNQVTGIEITYMLEFTPLPPEAPVVKPRPLHPKKSP